MCCLVIGTPSSNGITNVAAAKLNLCVVAHVFFWALGRVCGRTEESVVNDRRKLEEGTAGCSRLEQEGLVDVSILCPREMKQNRTGFGWTRCAAMDTVDERAR